MYEGRVRSQWDTDFICPKCRWWLRPRGIVVDEGGFAEVKLRCGECCSHYIICIDFEEFKDETEPGRHIRKYLKPSTGGDGKGRTDSSSEERKKRKKHTVGSEIYGRGRAQYKSARRIKGGAKETK